MDFRFSPEEEAFRNQFRSWLDINLPQYFSRAELEEGIDTHTRFDRLLAWHTAMYRAGWIGIHWPKEYGGRGATLMEQAIYQEELQRAGAPPGANPVGVWMVGPTLMHWGTEEQKKSYIPKILSAEEIWCQGYSEPGAGSDLASLQTRAVEDGDYFIVNGQKVWTTLAHRARRCILLVRTEPDAPKHRGLSYLLVDMQSPGITVRPLVQITGDAEFNEVFFEDVRVPKTNLVGEKNQGWQVALTTLMFERANIGAAALQCDRLLNELIEIAKRTHFHGRPAAENTYVRQKIAQFAIDAEAIKYNSYRQLTKRLKGQPPGAEGSVSKLFGTELCLRMVNFAAELLGPYGLLTRGASFSLDRGKWARRILSARALTIGGGTSEVQRNILGERILGLPKG